MIFRTFSKGCSNAGSIALVVLMLIFLSSCYGPTPNPSPSNRIANENPDQQGEWLAAEGYKGDLIDPHGGLSRLDYDNLFYAPKKDIDAPTKPEMQLPGMSNLMEMPKQPILAGDKLVTLMVTDDVPLKDVLVELARRAEVDMEIDPQIAGGIIFSANERPFSEVIDRLSNLAGLRYSVDKGVFKVERDVPYITNYQMNILNVTRTTSSSVSISSALGGNSANNGNSGSGSSSGSSGSSSGNTNSGSGGTGTAGSSSGGMGGSSSQVNTTISDAGDMWSVVEEGLKNILVQYGPKITQPNTQAATATVSADGKSANGSTILSLNRQAGIISVLATQRQHTAVKEYLDYVHMAHSSQVLIEAKVLEVTLKDEFRSGINWDFTNGNVTSITAAGNFGNLGIAGAKSDQIFSLGVLPAELFGWDKTSLDATINLVEEFGATRTLSSPRISAMNNQYAVLTFAENYTYFVTTIEESTETTDTGDITTYTASSEINTTPIGVVLVLQPSIDLTRQEIIMNIRPTLTRITNFVQDPAVAIQAAKLEVPISSEIPVVDVREIDSVLRIKSGQVMVIGGLMEERSTNVDRGIPGVSKVPLLGNAFKNVTKDSEVVETVIFIKATIVPGTGVSVEDRDFYKKFSVDRRALNL